MNIARHRFLASLFALALGLLPGLLAIAAPERNARVAVVIGNSAYKSGALANPVNDATAMAAALKRLDFDVELKLDATKADFNELFKRFAAKAEKAQVAAIFYAGHGIQVGGANYIVPVDANPQSERDLKRELVKMDDLIDDMGDARVKLIFFDACRDNPLSRSFSRGGTRGMAAPVEATGTLISFATKHGNTALDGTGRHSPYTLSLLAALENPAGVEIEQMLRRVQQGVRQATNGQQEPWRYGSLDGDFFFQAAVAPAAAKAQQEAVDRAVQEATRRAAEQAARERAELQAAMREQQESAQRLAKEAATLAAQEAMRRANEQVARERAEMQASMEKLLNEALAKQNAALEAERAARAPGVGSQAAALPAPSATAAVQLAAVTPTPTASAPALSTQTGALAQAPGDEWEYKLTDRQYSKEHRLVLRTKAATSSGLLEEISFNGRALDWVFGSQAAAIGLTSEAHFMFAPNWDGRELQAVLVEGGGGACVLSLACRITLRPAGTERITTPAGSFEAIRLEGEMRLEPRTPGPGSIGATTAKISIWYSRESRRLLRQVAKLSAGRHSFDEVMELVAMRGTGPAAAPAPAPLQVASRSAPLDAAAAAPAKPGDEWEYVASDLKYGKKQTLVLQTRLATATALREQLFWAGRPLIEGIFGNEAAAIAIPGEAGFLFAPNWTGLAVGELRVEGGEGGCAQADCRLVLKVAGEERITTPAGSFDAVRLEGQLNMKTTAQGWTSLSGSHFGTVTIWYSREQRRLLRQAAKLTAAASRFSFDEVIELSAVRRAAR